MESEKDIKEQMKSEGAKDDDEIQFLEEILEEGRDLKRDADGKIIQSPKTAKQIRMEMVVQANTKVYWRKWYRAILKKYERIQKISDEQSSASNAPPAKKQKVEQGEGEGSSTPKDNKQN